MYDERPAQASRATSSLRGLGPINGSTDLPPAPMECELATIERQQGQLSDCIARARRLADRLVGSIPEKDNRAGECSPSPAFGGMIGRLGETNYRAERLLEALGLEIDRLESGLGSSC